MTEGQTVLFAVLILVVGAGIMAVMNINADKIADSIEAGRGVDTVYVADSLIYKLEIQVNDTLSGDFLELLGNHFKTVRIVPRGIKE